MTGATDGPMTFVRVPGFRKTTRELLALIGEVRS